MNTNLAVSAKITCLWLAILALAVFEPCFAAYLNFGTNDR